MTTVSILGLIALFSIPLIIVYITYLHDKKEQREWEEYINSFFDEKDKENKKRD